MSFSIKSSCQKNGNKIQNPKGKSTRQGNELVSFCSGVNFTFLVFHSAPGYIIQLTNFV